MKKSTCTNSCERVGTVLVVRHPNHRWHTQMCIFTFTFIFFLSYVGWCCGCVKRRGENETQYEREEEREKLNMKGKKREREILWGKICNKIANQMMILGGEWMLKVRASFFRRKNEWRKMTKKMWIKLFLRKIVCIEWNMIIIYIYIYNNSGDTSFLRVGSISIWMSKSTFFASFCFIL